jgi:hypothetical protein
MDIEKINSYFTNDFIARFAQVAQPRSNYQLEKFVVNAHDTPEMQYVQILNEVQALYYTIKKVDLQLKKTEIEIADLRATGHEIDELEAQIKELSIEETKVVAVGAFRELEYLLGMLEKYPQYTRLEIELGQEEYWEKRLTRQANHHALTSNPNLAAHLEALVQAGLIEDTAPTQEIEK